MDGFGIAILLTTIAGFSTGIGSLLGIVVRPGPRFMAASLGFAAGIMILISFVELLPQAVETIGVLRAHIAFFIGMLVMFIIDASIPHMYMAETPEDSTPQSKKLRTGLLLALGIGIHNLPEGMATFSGALKDTDLGIAMAVAISIHNIPEGLAVSLPVYAATGSRKKAFTYSFLSGVAEPVGALLAGLVLLPVLTPDVLAYMLASIGGVMVFISLDELVPASREYGHEHWAVLAAVFGMVVMDISLILLGP